MPTPFEVSWSGLQMAEARRAILAAPLPVIPPGGGWDLGCDLGFLDRFRAYWLEEFDWRACVAELNRFPQFIATIDGQDVHFVHVRGERSGRPLLLTHGWPGSHYEFWDMVERLTTPSRHGGDAADAFDVVIPSLPGYAFSGKPRAVIGPKRVAALWNELMVGVLGYPSYLAHGGDWGSVVTSHLGLSHPATLGGIHLNMAVLRSPLPAQNDEEVAWAKLAARRYARLGGYSIVQSFKPASLAWLSAGNPLGQAAWILERFHDWSDLRRGDLEHVFGLRRLATNVMLYVMTDSFASSMWLYHGMVQEGGLTLAVNERCHVPTGFAAFPHDAVLPLPPRSRVELLYNVVHWTDFEEGGHFAAMEQPVLLARDLQEWARSL